MLYWFFKYLGIGPLMHGVWHPTVEGLENVPEKGPAIFASNHVSFSDSFFLPLVVPRRITFLAKSDYFTGTGVKGALTKAFFAGVGQVPVDRSGGSASEAALQTGLSILRSGELLGIYPEGTRSPDGRLYRGKTGVARMALEARVPVLPTAMIGTYEVQPPGQTVPTVGPIHVKIGAPLDFSRYYGREHDRFVLRAVTDEIMYELMLLSGQEYVDIYAGRARELLAQQKADKAEAAGAADAAGADGSSGATDQDGPVLKIAG